MQSNAAVQPLPPGLEGQPTIFVKTKTPTGDIWCKLVYNNIGWLFAFPYEGEWWGEAILQKSWTLALHSAMEFLKRQNEYKSIVVTHIVTEVESE